MENTRCNRCRKTDDKPKLADRGGTWVHHSCYLSWDDRQAMKQRCGIASLAARDPADKR